jgi:hypothetical protein
MKTPIPVRVTTLEVHLGQIRTREDRPQSPKKWIIVSLFIRHGWPLLTCCIKSAATLPRWRELLAVFESARPREVHLFHEEPKPPRSR